MIRSLVGVILWVILQGLPQALMGVEPDMEQLHRWAGIAYEEVYA